jgi:hypothetical protein
MDHFFGLEKRHFSPNLLTKRSREQEIDYYELRPQKTNFDYFWQRFGTGKSRQEFTKITRCNLTGAASYLATQTCYASHQRGESMNTVTKKTKIDADGWLKVQAPAELENQEVDVIIVPQRPPAAERVAAWQDLGEKAQNLPDSKAITEEEIQSEIDDYRAGR